MKDINGFRFNLVQMILQLIVEERMTNKDLPPIRLSPRTGIEIDLRVSRLSLLVPCPPPVNAEEEC